MSPRAGVPPERVPEPPVRAPARPQRLADAAAEQGARCLWCGRRFTALVAPTTDHVVPRARGGPSWVENEVAACRRCNAQRGHLAPTDWYLECLARGWAPDGAALLARLRSLDAAIADRGGQRRARPHLAAALRRLPPVLSTAAGPPGSLPGELPGASA